MRIISEAKRFSDFFIANLKNTSPFQGEDELSFDMSSSFRGNPAIGGKDVIRQIKIIIFIYLQIPCLGVGLKP